MLFLIKMGYFFKIIYLRFLPINDNFLQDLSTFFYWYVHIKPFCHLLEILNDFKLHLLANRGGMG